jgi:hypothetical protein
MNPYKFSRNLLGVACACLALASCQTNQPTGTQGTEMSTASNKSGGHFILHRQADLGIGLVLQIDGGEKQTVRVADTFDTYLAPGQHVISVIPSPNEQNQAASTATLMVENGKTYSFTAIRQGGNVVLVKDS